MIKINKKRSPSDWRVTLFFLGFLGSLELISSVPINPERSKENTSSPAYKRRSLEQDIESPSDLAWRSWLLEKSQSGYDSSHNSPNVYRRITPKSVFIAPQLELDPCADGYTADNMGRCQKIVNIDQEAYENFVLQRLHKLLGKGSSSSDSSSKEKTQPVATGPLLVNIPLIPDSNQDDSTSQIEEEAPLEAIPLETKQKEFIDYNVRNATSESSEEETEEPVFLDANFTIHKNKDEGTLPGFNIPVADFNAESNESISGIVDYKITPGVDKNVNNASEEENSTKDEYSTTLSSKDDVNSDEESEEVTTTARDTRIENVTESPTRKEITSDPVADIDSEMETWRNESDASPIQVTKKNETIQADVVYEEEFEPDPEDEEYSDTTQVSEEDTGDSEDEILKHGETGMMIPAENQALIRSEKKRIKSQITKGDYPMETTTFFDVESDLMPTTERGGEDLESNVSSQVSINKDFIVETTLLDVNSEKVKNSTEPVSANSTGGQQNRDDDDLKALTEAEKKLITEPEVVFSPQDNRGTNVYDEKRDGQLLNANFQSIKESHNLTTTEPPVVSKPLPHSSRLRESAPRPIETEEEEDEGNFHSKRILPLGIENKFPLQSSNLDLKSPDFGNYRPASVNRGGDFVKFPNERNRQGYVRFPSDDVNSIHSPEIKDRFTYSRDEYPSSSVSTKSGNSFNQKQNNWRISQRPRNNHQQTFMQAQTSTNQNPMLLRFWERMPLLRDPSLDPRYPTSPSEKEANSRSSRVSPSRRINFYKEKSPPHEVKRIFSQNMRSPIGG